MAERDRQSGRDIVSGASRRTSSGTAFESDRVPRSSPAWEIPGRGFGKGSMLALVATGVLVAIVAVAATVKGKGNNESRAVDPVVAVGDATGGEEKERGEPVVVEIEEEGTGVWGIILPPIGMSGTWKVKAIDTLVTTDSNFEIVGSSDEITPNGKPEQDELAGMIFKIAFTTGR